MSFEYNSSGLRTKKVVGNKTIEYYYSGDLLIAQFDGEYWVRFIYSPSGEAIGFAYSRIAGNGELVDCDYCYYVKNVQGDILGFYSLFISIFREYTYDAWGNITGVYNQYGNPVTDPEDPAFINPLRYRSYYYDDESGLYYLNSRYYNPEWGSFISADGYVSTGEQIVAKNMYAYCLNNPANYADPSGMACICMTQRVHGDHVCYDIVNTKPSNSYDPYEYLHGTNIVNTMPKYEPSIGDNSWLKEAAGGITLNYSIAGADEFIEKFLVTVPQSPLMTGAKSMIGLSNVCDNIGIISMAALSWQMAWDITNYQGSPEKQIASVALNVVNAVVSASVGTVITASSSAVVWPVVLSVGLSMIIDSCFGVIKGNLLG